MTIGDVARKVGLRPSALRYYEKIGLLPRPERVRGQRRYEAGVLGQLAVIDAAKRAGFRIGEIKQLFHGWQAGVPASRRWRVLGRRKAGEMAQRIATARHIIGLLKNVDRCDCRSLEDCGRAIMRFEARARRAK